MALYMIDNKPTPIDFECNDDFLRRTLQNAKNLLMCRMGEVPYDRRRGINPALFELGLGEMNRQLLPEVDRVLGWEPDVKAVSAAATRNENGETVITVTVEVDV